MPIFFNPLLLSIASKPRRLYQDTIDLYSTDSCRVHCCCFVFALEQAGFPLTFMTGFGVSAVQGFPDTQLW
jgi:hypothetical protein